MTRALVIGRSREVWDEAARAQAICKPFDFVVVCNSTGVDYPEPIDHWVTFHVTNIHDWIQKRRAKGFPDAKHCWTSISQAIVEGLTTKLEYVNCADGGSTGMLGVMCARQNGADKIVLAGIPMEVDKGWYNEAGNWEEGWTYIVTWEQRKAELAPYLRSMSGWTRAQFGYPTVEWLKS